MILDPRPREKEKEEKEENEEKEEKEEEKEIVTSVTYIAGLGPAKKLENSKKTTNMKFIHPW